MDILSKALTDFNYGVAREFTLKPEQEIAVRAQLDGKDVLALLSTGYGKSLIYQTQDINSIWYSAVDIRELTVSEIHQCNFKVMLASERKSRRRLSGLEFTATSKNFAVVVDVSLLLIEFCVLRITRIRPGKVFGNQGLPRTSLSNSDLFAVVEWYFCVALFRPDSYEALVWLDLSQPASLLKSFSAFADTAFSLKLYRSAAFRI